MIHQIFSFKFQIIFYHFFQDIIGKTDVEIFTGSGVRESQDFKMEVLEKGLPAKREITFETELFGSKTFLIYVEPVFSKTGETIGINYMGMDVTDQVKVIVDFLFFSSSFVEFLVLNVSCMDIYVSWKMKVRKRERMAKIREEIAVQKAKETELNKTIHITGRFIHPLTTPFIKF